MRYTEAEIWEIIKRVGWVVTATDNEPWDGVTTYSCSLHDDNTNYVGDFVGNLKSGYTFELVRLKLFQTPPPSEVTKKFVT